MLRRDAPRIGNEASERRDMRGTSKLDLESHCVTVNTYVTSKLDLESQLMG